MIYLALFPVIVALVLVGWFIGEMFKPEMSNGEIERYIGVQPDIDLREWFKKG